MTAATGWELGPASVLCEGDVLYEGDGELTEVMVTTDLFPLLFSLAWQAASTMAWMMGWYPVPFGKFHLSFERLLSLVWKTKGLWHLVQPSLLTSNCPSSCINFRVFGVVVRGLRGRSSGIHFVRWFKEGTIIMRPGLEFHCNHIQLCMIVWSAWSWMSNSFKVSSQSSNSMILWKFLSDSQEWVLMVCITISLSLLTPVLLVISLILLHYPMSHGLWLILLTKYAYQLPSSTFHDLPFAYQ